jgi:hypothetical protein
LNQNPEQSGFFEESGRVKCIKLRGIASEGIVLRREVNGIDVYKLKSINFLEKESKMLDRGEIDIESNQ